MKGLSNDNNSLFAGWSLLFLAFLSIAVFSGYYYLIAVPFACVLFMFGWQTLSIPFFVLIISIPFSMEFQVSSAIGTDIPDEALMLLVSTLFLFNWIYQPQLLTGKTLRHPILIILSVSVGWAFLSSLFSTQPLLSVKFLLAKIWYLGAFVGAALILFQRKRSIQLTAIFLSAAMVTVTLIILIRHLGYNFSFAHINDALKPYFRNHVNYSALLVCVTPLLYAFFRFAKSKRIKLLIAIVLIIVLVALFLSYARGAWLALLVGACAWWLIRKRALMAFFLITLMVCSIMAAWLIQGDRYLRYAHDYKTTIFHEDFSEHLVATYKMKDVSTAERFYRWIAGVRMIKDKPVTGFGPNSFYYNYRPYAVPAFKTWVSDNPEHSTVHNYFLLLIIEQGIPGLLAFLFLCGMLVYYAQRVYYRSTDIFYKRTAIVAGSMLMMILTVNFLSDLMETDKIGSIFFLCLSALVVADIKSSRTTSQE